ncbi:MAG: hypothetical protein ACXIUD_07290 [Mongoliitalea sp.]
MKPLILHFAEKPSLKELDFSLVEYSQNQNLTVIKETTIPAIKYISMETETFTKTSGEPSDSDRDYQLKLKYLLDTKPKYLHQQNQAIVTTTIAD